MEGTFEKEHEYLKLENYARTHKIGLWAYSTYTTPTSTKLKDKAGHTFVFPDITIQPGESIYIYSGKGVNFGNKLYWGDGAIWNNDGDTALPLR